MDNLDQFFKGAKKVKFPEKDFHGVRASLASFIDREPVREAHPFGHILQRLTFAQLFMTKKYMPIALGLLISLLTGGGITYAAEQALPGDTLYPVKIGFNEPLRAALAVSPEARGRIEAERIERRVQEAEKIVERAEKNIEANANNRIGDMEDRLKKQVDHTQEVIKKLEEKGNEQAAASLKAHVQQRVELHTALLDALKSGDTEAAREKIQEAREQLEDSKDVKLEERGKVAAQGRLHALENKLEALKNHFDAQKDSLSAEARVKVEADFNKVDESFVRAKVQIEAEAYTEVFQILREAELILRDAKQIIRDEVSEGKPRDEVLRRKDESENAREKRMEERREKIEQRQETKSRQEIKKDEKKDQAEIETETEIKAEL